MELLVEQQILITVLKDVQTKNYRVATLLSFHFQFTGQQKNCFVIFAFPGIWHPKKKNPFPNSKNDAFIGTAVSDILLDLKKYSFLIIIWFMIFLNHQYNSETNKNMALKWFFAHASLFSDFCSKGVVQKGFKLKSFFRKIPFFDDLTIFTSLPLFLKFPTLTGCSNPAEHPMILN